MPSKKIMITLQEAAEAVKEKYCVDQIQRYRSYPIWRIESRTIIKQKGKKEEIQHHGSTIDDNGYLFECNISDSDKTFKAVLPRY